MATANGRGKRQRGEIEELPSGSLRVKVYAGIDPITKKRHYLTETIPPGATARKGSREGAYAVYRPGGRAAQPTDARDGRPAA
ncbi:hypothetical protein [Micromonospora sp. AKA38]|uniref:hypothetical protein n=1 Tax=Micromonospora sp. AKA38 TaxID=2733861 RepID=UPI0022C0E84D|nr:hypothetical protein [Micromonospora sp. AKA38]GHJ14185.1 hypothetical protein TPA0908_21800 [Micromonospora sp. AKA38]